MTALTVITPIGPDHHAVFPRALQSVRDQTVPLRHLYEEDTQRAGPGVIRNRLLRQVTTSYVTFLDADDWLEPDFGASMLAYARPDAYVYSGWYQDDDILIGPERPWCDGTFHLVTAVVPTAAAIAVGGFDESLPGMEDTDFYLKLYWRGVCGIWVPRPLLHYEVGGGRGLAIHNDGSVFRLRREINARYGGRPMGCCGDYEEQVILPTGQKQEGDVLARALWAGNRREIGRATGRIYPRTSYPKTEWVDPRDIAHSRHLWQETSDAPLPEPEPVIEAEPEEADHSPRLEGIAAVEVGLIDNGVVYVPPPPVTRINVAPLPNVRKVRRLARAVDAPIFIAPRQVYPSYSDFWTLVQLSGYEVLYADEINPGDTQATYIFSGPEDIPDLTGWQARTVFWQLEYAGDYTEQANIRSADYVWSSDPHHAAQTDSRYVLLGSHRGLNPSLDRGSNRYDVTMLAYMTDRRRRLQAELDELNWSPDYPGHDGEGRHDVLRTSRLMLHAHQHDEAALTPLRFALAAAYRLPVIAEAVPDSGNYLGKVQFAPYGDLPTHARRFLSGEMPLSGDKLYQWLCEDYTFYDGVEEALAHE